MSKQWKWAPEVEGWVAREEKIRALVSDFSQILTHALRNGQSLDKSSIEDLIDDHYEDKDIGKLLRKFSDLLSESENLTVLGIIKRNNNRG